MWFIFKTPFLFLTLDYPSRNIYVLYAPLTFASVITIILIVPPLQIPVLGLSGYFAFISSALPILGGFFVAALTVILSASNKVLNETMVGDSAPRIGSEKEPLTRVRFLALLFGYLSFSCFALFGIIGMVQLFGGKLSYFLGAVLLPIKILTIWLITFWLSQAAVMTMIGLHYLTDRLYRADGKAKFRNKKREDDS